MRTSRMEGLKGIVVISVFAAAMLFPAAVALHAQSVQIGPGTNPAGTTIDTPLDLSDPPLVTAHNNIDFTNNGTVNFWGSFDNRGTFNNNGRMEDYIQFLEWKNYSGAVLNNNASGLYVMGNGVFYNDAGSTLNNYGRVEVNGTLKDSGLIVNQPGGYWWNGTNTWIEAGGVFINNGTYEGWVLSNAGGTVINNAYWRHHSGIVWNGVGGVFYNNGHMTTEQWYVSTMGILNDGIFYNTAPGIIDNGNNMRINNSAGATFTNAGTINNLGTINNAGTMEFTAGSAYNFAGGTFNNDNGGILILNRDFTFDGATGGTMNLNAGSTLQNNAKLTNPAGHTQTNNGTLINAAVGTLVNNGTIDGTGTIVNNGLFTGAGDTGNSVQNNGTVAAGNSIGTLTIIGNYTQNPGSTLEVELSPAAADKLVITGTATLNGGTVKLLPTGLFVANKPYTYTILSAAGGSPGHSRTWQTPPRSWRIRTSPTCPRRSTSRSAAGPSSLCARQRTSAPSPAASKAATRSPRATCAASWTCSSP